MVDANVKAQPKRKPFSWRRNQRLACMKHAGCTFLFQCVGSHLPKAIAPFQRRRGLVHGLGRFRFQDRSWSINGHRERSGWCFSICGIARKGQMSYASIDIDWIYINTEETRSHIVQRLFLLEAFDFAHVTYLRAHAKTSQLSKTCWCQA